MFGYVWFLGAAGTYVLLFAMPRSIKTMLTPDHPYDAAGYVSFVTCSVVALLTGIFLLIRNRSDLRKEWPNWRDASRCLFASSFVMAPVWLIYIVLAENYRFRLPGDGNWVAISAGAFIGIVHEWLCKRWLRFRRAGTQYAEGDEAANSVNQADVFTQPPHG